MQESSRQAEAGQTSGFQNAVKSWDLSLFACGATSAAALRVQDTGSSTAGSCLMIRRRWRLASRCLSPGWVALWLSAFCLHACSWGSILAGSRAHADKPPLHRAVRDNQSERVAQLLAAGANPDAVDNDNQDRTALHLAVEAEAAHIVAQLLAAGANPDAVDDQGRTPLSEAVRAKATDMMAQLLAAGANPNLATPLHKAMGMRYLEGGQALLAAGADPNAVDDFGYTPLHEAAGTSLWEGIRMLLAAGADPDARDERGARPLHIAVQSDAARDIVGAPSTAWVTVEMLLAAGADPDARMNAGETPLWWASRYDDPTTAAVLLAAGADPEARTEAGETPLSIARGHYRQYDPSRRVRGLSASLQAIRYRRAAAMIDLLRTHGARE